MHKTKKKKMMYKKKYQWKQVSSQASNEQEHQAWLAELKRENTQKREKFKIKNYQFMRF